MRAVNFVKATVFGLSVLALSACEEGASFGQQGFQSQYATARDALEAGQYDRAIRSYQRLLPQAGPFAPRLQLELAHAYLRSGNYAAAAKEARAVAQSQQDDARAAALSVQGTADHELGLQAIAAGDNTRAAAFLKQADAALAEVLKSHPELDPVGALAGRRASIAVQRKRIGG